MSILLNQVFNLHTARMFIVVTFVFTKKKPKKQVQHCVTVLLSW